VGWEEVAAQVPEYGEQVRSRIAQFGRDHPFIRTEYFLEELDAEGQLFGPGRRAQMRGYHPRQRSATPGRVYALLVDVAGAEEEIADCKFGRRVRTNAGSYNSQFAICNFKSGRYCAHGGGGRHGGAARPFGDEANVQGGGHQSNTKLRDGALCIPLSATISMESMATCTP
jgi:hypothetical protein